MVYSKTKGNNWKKLKIVGGLNSWECSLVVLSPFVLQADNLSKFILPSKVKNP